MRGTLANSAFQAESVKVSYDRAVREGNTTLANAIIKANPDLSFKK